MRKLSKAQIKKAKKLIKEIGQAIKAQTPLSKTVPIYDEAYFKALEYMDNN